MDYILKQWAILKRKPIKKEFFFLSLALFAIIVGLIYLHQFSYNSDDVAEQTIYHSITLHGIREVWLPPDPWLLKFPVYALIQALLPSTRSAILLTSAFMNVALVMLIFSAAIYFNQKIIIKKLNLRQKWIWFVWVFSLSPGFILFLRMPNTRNFELGIMLVLIIYLYRLYIQEITTSSWLEKTTLISITILIGICLYSDPYFYVFLALFLAVFFLAELLKRKLVWDRLVLIGAMMTSAIIIYGLIHYWLDKSGFHIAEPPRAFIKPSDVWMKISLLWEGIKYIFSVELPISGHHILNIFLRMFNILLGLIGFAAAAFVLFHRRSRSFETALAAQPFLVVLVYIIVKGVNDIGTARYLVLVPLYFIFIFPIAISYLKPKQSKLITNFAVTLVVVNLVSVSIGAGTVIMGHNHLLDSSHLLSRVKFGRRLAVDNPRNLRERKIINILESRGLERGYSDYWGSLITGYLANHTIQISQILCDDSGRVRPYYWVVHNANYNPRPKQKTFLMFDSYNLNHTACQLDIFGPIQELITVDDHTVIFVYDYDVASKFPPEASLSKPD